MINSILVTTDFSTGANHALRYAIGIANHAKAEVHLLHSAYIPVPGIYFTSPAMEDIMASVKSDAASGFEKLKKEYFRNTNLKFISTVVFGTVQETVQEYVDKHQIDLVIMGTCGSSEIDDLLIGSNTAEVIRKCPVPVMAVPPEATYTEFRDIVYATDNYGPEFAVVSKLIYFADMFGAKVHVITAETDFEKYLGHEENFFVKNKEHLSLKKWDIKKVFSENVTESINRFVSDKHAGLLVMSKHKRNFFSRIFHRSLSKRMIFHTKVPLLVIGQENG